MERVEIEYNIFDDEKRIILEKEINSQKKIVGFNVCVQAAESFIRFNCYSEVDAVSLYTLIKNTPAIEMGS